MPDKLMNISQGKSMPATSMAVSAAVDSFGNLVYRFAPGTYTKKAASGYPEIYLNSKNINLYNHQEYLIVSVAFQGGYSGSPIPEHSYVYFKYSVSSDEENIRLAGNPYITGVGAPGSGTLTNILGVNILTATRKTGQNYQEYSALSNLLIAYSSIGQSIGTTINSGTIFNLNPGVHMLARI